MRYSAQSYTPGINLYSVEYYPSIINTCQVKAELDEVSKGLADADVLDVLHKYPELFRPLFIPRHSYRRFNTINIHHVLSISYVFRKTDQSF